MCIIILIHTVKLIKRMHQFIHPTNNVNTQILTSIKLTVYIIDKQYKFSKC